MNNNDLRYAQSKINHHPSGRYELSDIFADDWQSIDCPSVYGRQFRRAAASGRLKFIKPIGRKSNNHMRIFRPEPSLAKAKRKVSNGICFCQECYLPVESAASTSRSNHPKTRTMALSR